MTDPDIIKLFFRREERAIDEASKKYGGYCNAICFNILKSKEDSEECVNDTLAKAWDSIPPQTPKSLKTFLGRIARNTAINRYNYNTAEKRNAETALAIDELYEVLEDKTANVEQTALLTYSINEFLSKLSKRDRQIFVKRYWYVYSVKEIAKELLISESNVKTTLFRLRNDLKEYLSGKETEQ